MLCPYRSTAHRGGAVVVREYDAALGQHRLLFVVFGHFAAGVSEILLDAPQALLIGYQRQAEDIGHGFTGQIVLRRSQSPGQQHEVAAAHRQAQHLPKRSILSPTVDWYSIPIP